MAQTHADRPDRPPREPQASGGQRPAAPADAQEVRQIFVADGYLAVNRLGERIGNQLAGGGVTRSQVRNILESFQNIAETWDATEASERGREIALLKPRLIYLAARETTANRRQLLEHLATALGIGIDVVLADGMDDPSAKKRFTALVDLVEAITAYHRARARA